MNFDVLRSPVSYFKIIQLRQFFIVRLRLFVIGFKLFNITFEPKLYPSLVNDPKYKGQRLICYIHTSSDFDISYQLI